MKKNDKVILLQLLKNYLQKNNLEIKNVGFMSVSLNMMPGNSTYEGYNEDYLFRYKLETDQKNFFKFARYTLSLGHQDIVRQLLLDKIPSVNGYYYEDAIKEIMDFASLNKKLLVSVFNHHKVLESLSNAKLEKFLSYIDERATLLSILNTYRSTKTFSTANRQQQFYKIFLEKLPSKIIEPYFDKLNFKVNAVEPVVEENSAVTMTFNLADIFGMNLQRQITNASLTTHITQNIKKISELMGAKKCFVDAGTDLEVNIIHSDVKKAAYIITKLVEQLSQINDYSDKTPLENRLVELDAHYNREVLLQNIPSSHTPRVSKL